MKIINLLCVLSLLFFGCRTTQPDITTNEVETQTESADVTTDANTGEAEVRTDTEEVIPDTTEMEEQPATEEVAPDVSMYEVRFVNFGADSHDKIADTMTQLKRDKNLLILPGGSVTETSMTYKVQWLREEESQEEVMRGIQEVGEMNGIAMVCTSASQGVLVFTPAPVE
jgi:hypothetical protein